VIRFGEDAGRAPFAPAQPARAAAALPPSLAAFLVAGRDAPLRPSGRPRGEAPGPAARRGRMAHRLLEALPADPALATVEAARRILAADGGDPAPDETEAALAAALRLRGAPETAALLAAPGIAEAPVAGAITLPDGSRRQVRGRIDRLVVTDDLVRIVDFKTGRRETAARARHVRQMALYAALIETIFAGRRVEASLVHVDDGVVETIPGLDLAAALAAIAAEGDAGGPT
jgi:ATP-dependent helicase/nuclease subunit A